MPQQNQSYGITFQHPQSETVDLDTRAKLILDQPVGWSDFAGYMTEANLVRYLGLLLYGEEFYSPVMECGLEDGKLVTVIQAYPYTSSLQYNIYTSYGELANAGLEFPELTTLITFTGANSGTVSYPIQSIVSTDWLGNVYDMNDNITTPPGVVYSGDEVRLTNTVHGTLELKYKTRRTNYLLTVEPREDTEDYETKFDTFVWATYFGGLAWLKVSEPPGADDLTGDAPCGYITNVKFKKPPPSNPDPKDKETLMDYCLLEEIGDGEGYV